MPQDVISPRSFQDHRNSVPGMGSINIPDLLRRGEMETFQTCRPSCSGRLMYINRQELAIQQQTVICVQVGINALRSFQPSAESESQREEIHYSIFIIAQSTQQAGKATDDGCPSGARCNTRMFPRNCIAPVDRNLMSARHIISQGCRNPTLLTGRPAQDNGFVIGVGPWQQAK